MGYSMMGNMFGNGSYYGGQSNGWWLLSSEIINVLILIVGILFIYALVKSKRTKEEKSTSAIKILKERYVLGEIDEEEYKKKMKLLQ